MSVELVSLIGAAVAIGFFHTLLGPDHYIPFIVMSKARNWSMGKTGVITFLCGIGHVASSVVLGAVGIAAGIALKHLEITESIRGEIAGWVLLASRGLALLPMKRLERYSHALAGAAIAICGIAIKCGL
jgi:nickel/cobalt exporter